MVGAGVISYRRVWVAGHRGLVGSAMVRRLTKDGVEVVTVDRQQLNLLDQAAVKRWLTQERPDAIVVAAAKVGGILANDTYPADFLSQNLTLQSNIIDGAHEADVNRLLFLGSSCIYPKMAEQPIQESSLMTGPLESTNEWYAVAKIAGIKMCQAYRKQFGRDYSSAMPCNVYGPYDNFDLLSSHVIPAMIRRLHDAKEAGSSYVTMWGTGQPLREFIYIDDLAEAISCVLFNYHEYEHINCGSGKEISIRDLAHLIAGVVGYDGQILFDVEKPDGTPRKLMDNSRLKALGWTAVTDLRDGIQRSYDWYYNR